MTLIVETGAGVAGSNSFISVADADTYHAARGNSGWTGSNTVKEQALIKAMDWLDRQTWAGTVADIGQGCPFPRYGVYDVAGRAITGVPAAVVRAQAEAALLALTGALDPPDAVVSTSNLKQVEVGPVNVVFKDDAAASATSSAVVFPSLIAILRGLLGSSSGWLVRV